MLLDKALDQRALQSVMQREETVDKLKTYPMEGAIDPKVYVVGPSDLLNVAVWGPVSFSYALLVTPEGTLIIPTVGEIHVADQKLADVKLHASGLVKKRYPSGDVSITLLRPRAFIVSLKGTVIKPGQYTATAVDRVEKIFVEGAGVVYPNTTFTIPAYSLEEGVPNQIETFKSPRVTQSKQLYEEASTRNIRLIRRNGDTIRVDIPKYYATRDDRYNPFVLDGDIIFVPRKILKRNMIAVYGAVNAPGEYEFVEGDSLLDLIGIAEGLLATGDSENVVLSRLDSNGLQAEEQTYSLTAIRADKRANPQLQCGDRILVKEKLHSRKTYGVTIVGEISSVGTYPISAEGTKLSKIIKDAGGVTEHALLSSSFILRKDDRLKDIVDPRLELLRNLRTHQLNMADSTVFLLDLKVGRQQVVVDFKKLIEEGDTTQDVILRDDDIIYIASNLHSVLVQGQVANPGYIAYVPGAGYQHYIDKAGGYAELAIEDEVKVIKKGTLEWKDPEKTVVESGDQIWVPKKQKKDFGYYFAFIRDASQIAAALVSIAYLVVAIQSLSK
jgi:protein involved in polysaccharide export with SLBB domain